MADHLTITRCTVTADKIEPKRGAQKGVDIFEVQINPEEFTRKYAVAYTGTGAGAGPIGKAAAAPEFARTEAETVNIKIVLDGTGVVEAKRGESVSAQIALLRDIAYEYKGDEHEPGPVELNWGDELKAFRARLTSLDVTYTLFDPTGAPLRADVTLDFVEALTPKEVEVEADKQSPDMTHLVRVVAGDTLPLLCERIYKDATRYVDVARENDLDGFRALAPDTLLRFRPIR